MNKTLLMAAIGLIAIAGCSSASAGQSSTTTSTSTANSSSSSTAGAVAVGGGGGSATAGGGSARIIFNQPGNTQSRIRQSGSLKTTGNAVAPGLGSAGVETCYGPGVSAGAGFVGGAVSFGMGQFDNDCNARLYSRTLFAFGHKEAALQLLINESQMVQRAFGVGAGGAAVTSRGLVYAGPTAQRGPAPCTKWRGDVVGLQCLY